MVHPQRNRRIEQKLTFAFVELEVEREGGGGARDVE